MNQSELKENTCNRHQAWEDAREQDMVAFAFVSHWLRKLRDFLLTNHRA